jgi:hypothetical protein
MSNPDLTPKKSKNTFYIGILAVVLIVIVGAASFYFFSSNGTPPLSSGPTMSNMAGTYVQQTSSGTGYNIVLYANGTALFSTYSGTWSIVNSTTIEGTYRILNFPRDDFFTITNNGFTAAQTGNVYIKK